MTLSGEDTLTRLLMPVAAEVFPRAEMRRRKRFDAAIDQSGFIEPDAVQMLGSLQVTTTLDDTAYNSTSTSAYTTCVSTTLTLGTGTWTVVVNAMSRGAHNAGTSIDYRINIDGNAYNEITRTAVKEALAHPRRIL